MSVRTALGPVAALRPVAVLRPVTVRRPAAARRPATLPRPATVPRAGTTRYDAVARASAAVVIRGYSTSFGWACRLLAEPVRSDVRDIYALVRVADEIVDTPDGRPAAKRARQLAALEDETYRAVRAGYSTNLVVHAFALTARRCGIGADLIGPFFASMRTDLSVRAHDAGSLDSYVYGSAEVVGLMCLRAFLADGAGRDAAYAALAPGARRLGAAFQKVNFLRDLAEDRDALGRAYFPGLDGAALTDARRDVLLDDIDADLAAAAAAIPQLPPSSRAAVQAAHDLFAALSRRLRATPARQIARERVRVPDPVKAAIFLRAATRRRR